MNTSDAPTGSPRCSQRHFWEMEDSRASFLSALFYVLCCNVIYMYFLDWNSSTLLIRALQLLLLYKYAQWSQSGASPRGSAFLYAILFSNIPILLIHALYRNPRPFLLTFMGQPRLASYGMIFLHDAFIIIMEYIIISHRKIRVSTG